MALSPPSNSLPNLRRRRRSRSSSPPCHPRRYRRKNRREEWRWRSTVGMGEEGSCGGDLPRISGGLQLWSRLRPRRHRRWLQRNEKRGVERRMNEKKEKSITVVTKAFSRHQGRPPQPPDSAFKTGGGGFAVVAVWMMVVMCWCCGVMPIIVIESRHTVDS
ncbi:uncharacterized protein [Spinacia oleracea]|uniref:Uncharacterized protein n=1 Tax=Spinacia oleracea TaxID=3562 RepID=A0ABM3R4U6_SPIOL|nr:uncharacterized protein LOC130465811 [Spinacia oleracea]